MGYGPSVRERVVPRLLGPDAMTVGALAEETGGLAADVLALVDRSVYGAGHEPPPKAEWIRIREEPAAVDAGGEAASRARRRALERG